MSLVRSGSRDVDRISFSVLSPGFRGRGKRRSNICRDSSVSGHNRSAHLGNYVIDVLFVSRLSIQTREVVSPPSAPPSPPHPGDVGHTRSQFGQTVSEAGAEQSKASPPFPAIT